METSQPQPQPEPQAHRIIYKPNVIDGIPTDFYENKDQRKDYPEQSFEKMLMSDAFEVSKEFFVLLHEPIVLNAITLHFLHSSIETAEYTHQTSEQHAEYIFNVMCSAPLKFEIISYVGNDKMLFFFGTQYPSLGVPLRILSSSTEVVGRIMRMCSFSQLGSGSAISSDVSSSRSSNGKHGSAFRQISPDRRTNRVTYTNFLFDATLDNSFPRSSIISNYVLAFLSHARSSDRDNNHYLKIDQFRARSSSPVPSSPLASAPLSRSASSIGMSLGHRRNSSSHMNISHSATSSHSESSLSSPPTPPPSSLYSNSVSLLSRALRSALKISTTPSVPRRTLRIKVGTESRGEMRVVETAPSDDEQSRRLNFMRKECAPLVQKLRDCEEGELKTFHYEVLETVNRAMERLVNFSFQ